MNTYYTRLATKLELLARPRIQVRAGDEALFVSLHDKAGNGEPLATFGFRCKGEDCSAQEKETVLAMSHFLETAALFLERPKPSDFHPTKYAQALYNQGFWTTTHKAHTWMTCKIEQLDYKKERWQ